MKICNYLADYIEDIYQTFLAQSTTELMQARSDLKLMTPPPMNTMLEKESKIVAIKKHFDRKAMVTLNIPPTTPCKSFGLFTVFISF